MVKVCSKCNMEKDFIYFEERKGSKDGFRNVCKECRSIKSKEYRKKNKDKLLEGKKKDYHKNKDIYKENAKQWRLNNKDKVKELNKSYHLKYRKERCKKAKDWVLNNKEQRKKYAREYVRNRYKIDPLFKLKCNLRTRTNCAFKNKGYSKNTRTHVMLGVDWKVCKASIERKFTTGMSWDNYGEWHMDHIIPLSFAITNEHLKELCHYTNLQPLWALDNFIKSDSINGQQVIMRI